MRRSPFRHAIGRGMPRQALKQRRGAPNGAVWDDVADTLPRPAVDQSMADCV